MFSFNVRRSLNVLLLVGLLMSAPLSSTALGQAKEGSRSQHDRNDPLPVSSNCDGDETCIIDTVWPRIGDPVGEWIVLAGDFPEDDLSVTLRNTDGNIVHYQDRVRPVRTARGEKHDRLRIKLKNFAWEAGSYSITVLTSRIASPSSDSGAGDTIDLDIAVSSDGDLIRVSPEVDIHKMIRPEIGEMMGDPIVLIGNFPEANLRITLWDPTDNIAYQNVVQHDGSNQLSVNVGHRWRNGTYGITVGIVDEQSSASTPDMCGTSCDTLRFGTELQSTQARLAGCSRSW